MMKKILSFIKSIFENKSFKGNIVQNINVGGVTEKEDHTNDE